MTKLFIYGTLKRGYHRSDCLAGQKFLGTARTLPGYRLYDNGSFPAMIFDQGKLSVQGELWKVDTSCLARLDEVEAVPTLYQRIPVKLVSHPEELVQAYLYQQSLEGWIDIGGTWPAESGSAST